VGELFTNPLPLALALWLWEPRLWPVVAAAAVLLRAAAGWIAVHRVLRGRLTFLQWLCVPLQDMLSFLFWIAGFFGTTVLWRGRHYQLGRDGRIALIE
jgi:ceramide glucosyltransferase